MKSIFQLSFIAVLIVFFSCKSNNHQNFTPETFTEASLTFGNYGGFAGTSNSYTLLNNGQFFKHASKGKSYHAIERVKESTCQQMFDNFNTLGISEMKMNDPGNLSFFVEYKKGEETNRLVWGGMNDELPGELKTYYQILMQLAKNQNKGAEATM